VFREPGQNRPESAISGIRIALLPYFLEADGALDGCGDQVLLIRPPSADGDRFYSLFTHKLVRSCTVVGLACFADVADVD
jgi:hypothetical protein